MILNDEIEVLELLDSALEGAQIAHTDPDDTSGFNTRFYVDYDQFKKNIESMLADRRRKEFEQKYAG